MTTINFNLPSPSREPLSPFAELSLHELNERMERASNSILNLIQFKAACVQDISSIEDNLRTLKAGLPQKPDADPKKSKLKKIWQEQVYRKALKKNVPAATAIKTLENDIRKLEQSRDQCDREMSQMGELMSDLEKTAQKKQQEEVQRRSEEQRGQEQRIDAETRTQAEAAAHSAVVVVPEALPITTPQAAVVPEVQPIATPLAIAQPIASLPPIPQNNPEPMSIPMSILTSLAVSGALVIEGVASVVGWLGSKPEKIEAPISPKIEPTPNRTPTPPPAPSVNLIENTPVILPQPIVQIPESALPSVQISEPALPAVSLQIPEEVPVAVALVREETPKTPKERLLDFFKEMPNYRSNPGFGEIFASLPDNIEVTQVNDRITIRLPQAMKGKLKDGQTISHAEYQRLDRFSDNDTLKRMKDKDIPKTGSGLKETSELIPLTKCKYFRSINPKVWDYMKNGTKFEIGPEIIIERNGNNIKFLQGGPKTSDGSLLVTGMTLKPGFEHERGCVEVSADAPTRIKTFHFSMDYLVGDIQALLPKLGSTT